MTSVRFIACSLLALVLACGCQPPVHTCQAASFAGPTDVTFLVAADAHFGAFEGIDRINARQVEAMNAMPGRPWPAEFGGVVDRPRGVLFAGDMTDRGTAGQWRQFVACYGRDGTDGPLHFPVHECTGNHDRHSFPFLPVLDGVRRRQGSLVRSWDWDGVHVACLDLYPDAAVCRWLAKDLAAAGTRTPIVLYFHYPLAGPYSEDQWWSQRDKQRFAEVVGGHNVVAIFHGHYHGSEHYVWGGRDVYNVGAARHLPHSFAVVRVTDDELTVASWDCDRGAWQWRHRKPIRREAGAEGGMVSPASAG